MGNQDGLYWKPERAFRLRPAGLFTKLPLLGALSSLIPAIHHWREDCHENLALAFVRPVAERHGRGSDHPAQNHLSHAQPKPATLMTGLGDLHHAVSTTNPQAQQFFDQGLRLIYAFNHDEAARSFQRATELDPKLAMAYWGVAEAVGPNYNDPASDERFAEAHTAIQKAVDLSANASPAEQAYIQAMALRFPADPKADRRQAAEAYHDAMREVVKNFPDDLDAATLFAESGMNLHPWGLWHRDGTPEAGTEEIVATLESVIKRDPNHMGAIHYYIHSVEASASPERALAAANRLAAMAPAAGHLVHMPAHVYIRTGDYAAAVKTNQAAACRSRLHQGQRGAGPLPHDVLQPQSAFHRHVRCHGWRLRRVLPGAQMLAAHVRPHVKDMPPLEGFVTIPIAVDVRFRKWDEILKMPKPILKCRSKPCSGTSPTAWRWPARASRTKPRPTTRL